MAKRYSQRPSSLLNIRNPELALDFDLAMAIVHRMEEDSKIQELVSQNPDAAPVIAALLR